jgi:hypothetical protein
MHFIKSVSYVSDYKLALVFEDDNVRLVDLVNELDGEIFEPLKDLAYFKTVRVDPDLDTIVWDNGADLAPEFLYAISVPIKNAALVA